MNISTLISTITTQPEQVSFEEVMETISEHYHYTPSRFVNGELVNESSTNEGSCKIFAFAKDNNLSEPQTLACFGRYYTDDVLKHPEGNDHGNIRNFMVSGWGGIRFDTKPLTKK